MMPGLNFISHHICKLLLSVALLLPCLLLHAQVIRGRVTDAETGNAIAGASVYLNGTYAGTITDTLGVFRLAISKTNIPLIVSYVGYGSHIARKRIIA